MRRTRIAIVSAALVAATLIPAQPANAVYRKNEFLRTFHQVYGGVIYLFFSVLITGGYEPFGGDPTLDACTVDVPLKLQKKRADGSWKTIASKRTNDNSKTKFRVTDRPGRYRVVAPAGTPNGVGCLRGVSDVKRHRHD